MDSLVVANRLGNISTVDSNSAGRKVLVERGGNNRAELVHISVWKNEIGLVEVLINEEAPLDTSDEESGWTPLHKALYWGRLRAAGLLLGAGVSLQALDHRGRSPLDLLSEDLQQFLGAGTVGEVYGWGNGSNYQLGSGAVGLQETPVRLDSLHGISLKGVAAAKFHSAAVTNEGKLFTWGFGRGGRLGHGEFHIHSGESAVILPQQVSSLAKRAVIMVALAKHHTAAITDTGEIFTWGSNRDGRLGYPATDTQPTPRKITTFNRQRVVDVAVANRHTVALLDEGSVFSWGSNLQGQLGYGTSDSASNATPRLIEAMKGKFITAAAAAKRHTVVLTSEGLVYTWGHRVVTPKRVVLAGSRDNARSSSAATGQAKGWEVVFHKGQAEISRPVAVLIAAGAAHSSAVTADGVVLTWRSMDPALSCQEVGGPLSGKRVVAVSAGKYRTAVVTSVGDLFMWEGWSKAAEQVSAKGASSGYNASLEGLPPEWEVPRGARQQKSRKALAYQAITPQRVEGLKRVTDVAVGEKHSVALQSWCEAPAFHSAPIPQTQTPALSPQTSHSLDEMEPATPLPARPPPPAMTSDAYWAELDATVEALEGHAFSQAMDGPRSPVKQPEEVKSKLRSRGPDSLQRLCERRVAVSLVEPRTVLQVLEFADAAGSSALRQHCAGVALSNLDLIIQESRQQFEQLMPHVLEALERQWTQRFPRATAVSVAAGQEAESSVTSPHLDRFSSSGASQSFEERPFRNPQEEAEALDRAKQERAIRKKLQQIDALEQKARSESLDAQQQAKVLLRPILQSALQALEKRRPLKAVKRILDTNLHHSPAILPSAHGEGPTGQKRHGSKKSRQRAKTPDNDPHLSEDRRGDQPATQQSKLPVAWLDPSADRAAKRSQSPAWSRATLHPSMTRVAGFADTTESSGRSVPIPPQGTPWETPRAHPNGAGEEKLSAASSSGAGKKSAKRKGGLSMFLAGQLETPESEAKPATPAPAPPRTPLTWAQNTPQSGITTSLREIQSQEAATSSGTTAVGLATFRRHSSGRFPEDGSNAIGKSIASPARTGQHRSVMPSGKPIEESSASTGSGITIALDDLVKKSKPIAVSKPSAPERKLPAWGNAPLGASPNAQTRLQDIQAEQEQKRESTARSWGASGASPGSLKSHALAAGPSWRQANQAHVPALGTSPSLAFPAGTSPSGRRLHNPINQPQNKWYIKDEPEIVPLRCIQTEESALKELSELYGARVTVEPHHTIAAPVAAPASGEKKRRPRPRKTSSGDPRSMDERGRLPPGLAAPSEGRREGEQRRRSRRANLDKGPKPGS